MGKITLSQVARESIEAIKVIKALKIKLHAQPENDHLAAA